MIRGSRPYPFGQFRRQHRHGNRGTAAASWSNPRSFDARALDGSSQRVIFPVFPSENGAGLPFAGHTPARLRGVLRVIAGEGAVPPGNIVRLIIRSRNRRRRRGFKLSPSLLATLPGLRRWRGWVPAFRPILSLGGEAATSCELRSAPLGCTDRRHRPTAVLAMRRHSVKPSVRV